MPADPLDPEKALREARAQVLSSVDNPLHQHRLGLVINRLARAAFEAGAITGRDHQMVWHNVGHGTVAPTQSIPKPDWLPKEPR